MIHTSMFVMNNSLFLIKASCSWWTLPCFNVDDWHLYTCSKSTFSSTERIFDVQTQNEIFLHICTIQKALKKKKTLHIHAHFTFSMESVFLLHIWEGKESFCVIKSRTYTYILIIYNGIWYMQLIYNVPYCQWLRCLIQHNVNRLSQKKI